MDGQITWLGGLSIAKDWLTLIIAGFGVCVAWKGLRTWQRQLKGTSQFDVAKRLMLKVYQIRQDIEFCRAPFRTIQIFTHDGDGKPIPKSEQQYYSSNKEMWSRFNVIVKTLNEIEFLLFESEIIIDKKIRSIFMPIEEVCRELRLSIEEYIEDCNHKYNNQRESEESRNRYRELRRIIYCRKNDEIEAKVNSAINELEIFIKPYIHG